MALLLDIPRQMRGRIHLPASKSISNRVLVMGALAGNARLSHLAVCDDTDTLQTALSQRPHIIDMGAAGTAMRFGTAYFATQPEEHILTGTERMRHRPIGVLVEALRTLGADIEYTEREGYPPLRIRGKQLRGGCIEMAAGVSSQYISALLMLGPTLAEGLRLRLNGEIISRPYIDMTLSLMRTFGAEAHWVNECEIEVAAKPYRKGVAYTVEADWSAASYWYELMALSTDAEACIHLPHLHKDSLQGDSRVSDFFRPLGVTTIFADGEVVLRKTQSEAADAVFRLDLSRQPDLAQTIAVTCAMQQRPFHLTGLQTLKIKETDRIEALRRELKKLGCLLDEANASELMFQPTAVNAPKPEQAPSIDTYDDHRMAMSFAPCAGLFPGLRINHPEVVSKSYPGFWQDLQSVGVKMETAPEHA